MRRLRTRCLIFALAAAAHGGGCSRDIVSSAPDAAAVSPAELCTVGGSTTVTVRGDAFDVMVTGMLTDSPEVVPASILLQRTNAPDGTAVADAPLVVAGAPWGDGGIGNARWHSRRELTFEIDRQSLPAGIYDVIVEAPGGERSVVTGGLILLPPPRVDRIVAFDTREAGPTPTQCQSGQRFIVIGEMFVQLGLKEQPDGGSDAASGTDAVVESEADGGSPANPDGVPPGPAASLSVIGPAGAVVPLSGELVQSSCRRIDGGGDWARCSELFVELRSPLPSGAYQISVINPEPFGCASTQPLTLTCSSP